MSLNIAKTAEDLFEKIRSRFEKISIGDEKANNTQDPALARFFNFDFVSKDGTNFGNIHISLIDERSIKVFFSKNITDRLNDTQQQEWYDFLRSLRMFAKRHMLSFDTRDISRSNLDIKDVKQQVAANRPYQKNDVSESIKFAPGSYPDVDHMPGQTIREKEFTVVVDLYNPTTGKELEKEVKVFAISKEQACLKAEAKYKASGWEAEASVIPGNIGENRIDPTKPPKKGTLKRQIWDQQRKDYLKGFAKDPHGRLEVGDHVAGPSGTSKVVKTVETSDYFRRRQREEDIISGKKPARKRTPNQTSDYQKRRDKEKANESFGSTPPTYTIEAYGIKGAKQVPWRKTFKNYIQQLATKNNEPVQESKIYGLNRTQSAQDVARKNARIIIKHSRPIVDEIRGARSRTIESIYIENTVGERFKVPSNSLAEARALARHVAEGGNVYDEFGRHITEVSKECSALREFMRGIRGKEFVDETADDVVSATAKHYLRTRNLLSSLKGPRGYRQYKATWESQKTDPIEVSESDLASLRQCFRQWRVDPRIDRTLETVYKVYKRQMPEQPLSEIKEFEDYLTSIEEGMIDDIKTIYNLQKDIKEIDAYYAKLRNNYSNVIKSANERANRFIEKNPDQADRVKKLFNRFYSKAKVLGHTNPDKLAHLYRSFYQTLDREGLKESNWVMPEQDTDFEELAELFKDPLPVGIDAMNAIGALYNLLGDDSLFNELVELAKDDSEADARQTIIYWLRDNEPSIHKQLAATIQNSKNDESDDLESNTPEDDKPENDAKNDSKNDDLESNTPEDDVKNDPKSDELEPDTADDEDTDIDDIKKLSGISA